MLELGFTVLVWLFAALLVVAIVALIFVIYTIASK